MTVFKVAQDYQVNSWDRVRSSTYAVHSSVPSRRSTFFQSIWCGLKSPTTSTSRVILYFCFCAYEIMFMSEEPVRYNVYDSRCSVKCQVWIVMYYICDTRRDLYSTAQSHTAFMWYSSRCIWVYVILVENYARDLIEIYVMLCEDMCFSRLDYYSICDMCVSSVNLVENYVMFDMWKSRLDFWIFLGAWQNRGVLINCSLRSL